jgi:hypothetical protein
MRSLYLLIAIILFTTVASFPQHDREKMMKQKSKLHQLEKIKLIEALNLDEETSLRFFARRNEMQQEVDQLENRADDILKDLEESLNANEKAAGATQRQLINELLNIKTKIEKVKKQFITSLSDILSTEQIAKYIVFEQKFREEIRKIIFDRRRSPR